MTLELPWVSESLRTISPKLPADAVIAFGLDAMGFVGQTGALAEELIVPGGAFFGLDAVFVTDLHQQFAVVQQSWQFAAQRAGSLGKVLDQKIGQGIDSGSNADFVVAARRAC